MTMSEEKKEEQIFLAGLQGVDLSKAYGDPVQDKLKEVEARAMERLGRSRHHEQSEFADIGIELISDDEE